MGIFSSINIQVGEKGARHTCDSRDALMNGELGRFPKPRIYTKDTVARFGDREKTGGPEKYKVEGGVGRCLGGADPLKMPKKLTHNSA